MTTAAQLEANRRNALRSTGPRTEQGKRRSSMNATRHGFTGRLVDRGCGTTATVPGAVTAGASTEAYVS